MEDLCECWRPVAFGPHSFGIERGKDKILVGSIDLNNGKWQVEILWAGRGGPIRRNFSDYASALIFVQGVEDAFARTTP
jgi:hypothetical protein